MTRIRVPGTIVHEPVYLQLAPRYFPVIGWIVGGLSILSFLVFSRFVSADAGVLASMITGLFVTGAFHEDGFADVCDGMGGGFNKEQILRIMKDSRIGAYGTIGLIAILASKFVLLKELAPNIFRVGQYHAGKGMLWVFLSVLVLRAGILYVLLVTITTTKQLRRVDAREQVNKRADYADYTSPKYHSPTAKATSAVIVFVIIAFSSSKPLHNLMFQVTAESNRRKVEIV